MTRRLALQALLVYLLLRGISALMIVHAAGTQVPVPMWTDDDVDYLDMTNVWDGNWYRTIAEQGYPLPLPRGEDGLVAQNAWAFYPLFPLVSRALMVVTGGSFPLVGSTLALLCGTAAAVLMAGLLARHVGPRTALLAVAVWGSLPASPALQISYTEGPAMLVLVAILWHLERRRWLVVAGLALVMGFTRPIAVPLAAVVAVALFLRWRRRRHEPISTGEYLRGAVALGVTGVAGLLWPFVVWQMTGVRDGYTETMASWRSGHVIEPFTPWTGMSRYVLQTGFGASPQTAADVGPVLLALLAGGLVVAVCGPWARGLGWVLRSWCLAYPAYLAGVLDPYTSTFRYLIPLFPMAVLFVGGGWGGGREPDRGMQVVRCLGFVALGLTFQWIWIHYLLVFEPPMDAPP